MSDVNLTGAAREIGLARRTLYNMIEDGRFNVRPIPNRKPRRWLVKDLKAWKEGRYVPPSE